MKYHRIGPREWFVLRRLDGTRSLDQLCREYQDEFSPQKVTKVELNQLLFRFHESGLTVSETIQQGDRLAQKRSKERQQKLVSQLTSLLFIRFPGVDPEPLLRRVYPWVKPLFHPLTLFLFLLLCFSAGVLFLTRLTVFTAEFPTIGAWLRLESLFLLAAVIGGTKILHELGHAFVCKHFGGECHQIGPMLLVFTPALYCDTSDAWMLTRRFERASVGMAGVAVEVFLAATATFVWAFTAAGIVHSLSMNVMFVCGVSTVLFNANPLLRYDGYYVLSDFVDVPNLGERSRRVLSSNLNRWFLGIEEPVEETMTPQGRLGLAVYAATAAAYRWSLTLLILWFLSLMLRPVGLESIGKMLCVLVLAGMIYGQLRPLFQFLNNPTRRGKIRMTRLLASLAGLAFVCLILLWPFGSSIDSAARLTPRQQTSVYITTPGVLQSLHHSVGDTVVEGDVIAALLNHDIEYQYLVALGRAEKQRELVNALRQSRYESNQASNELPATEALLEDLEEQLDSRLRRREGLVIRATASGTLMAGSRKPELRLSKPSDEFELVTWVGYPTDAGNLNCFLQSGTEVVTIAESDDWDVEIVLPQNEVQRIDVGANVKLALESNPAVVFTGKVVDISRAEWSPERDIPRWDDPEASRNLSPPSTSYVVRASVDDGQVISRASGVAGAQVISRIEAKPISVVGRIGRSLSSLLRFR
ncbi:efflux RND transporter periplasmic adaptor subunit [Novipirellula herctigrandis]